MAIAPLTKPVAAYVREFKLTALCYYRDGRIGISRDPSGADRAYWLLADYAGTVLQTAKSSGGDIEAAARKAGIEVVDHASVLARAEAAVARIQAGMQRAQQAGLLAEFNQQYKKRRRAAFVSGRNFISYQQARIRLQGALSKIAATGVAPEKLMQSIFEGEDS
jgi:hypothetical protein